MKKTSSPLEPGRSLTASGFLHVLAGSVLFGLLALVLTLAAPTQAMAQLGSNGQAAAPQTGLRVFLDCQGPVPCNRNHFRTEIQWVNWMNDRSDADVHLIITSEGVGGGGRRYTLDFIGRNGMSELSDVLTYTSRGTDVQIETLDGLTHAMALGLLRFGVEAGLGADFALDFTRELVFAESGGDAALAGPVEPVAIYDPWNYWTFRVGLSGNMSVQELRSSHRFNPSFGADRVTENWKFNFNTFANFNRESIQLSDRTVQNNRDSWNVSTLLVRSVTSHLSTGATIGGSSSTQNNRKARVTLTPAVEWNYYPYTQANRRQMIVHYGAGMQYNNYEQETVFGVLDETVPLHSLGVQYRAVEGWGNAGLNIEASQYLHQSGLYSFGASGNVSFRVARGLELSLSASGERIADQIHIRASALSEEDILLGRQSLPTGYQYQGSIGFNYRWGSSFSNIVNVRFPPSVR
jgi:hypothetical protein